MFIINFLSLNFTSVKIEGERVSFNQNERTLGEGGARKRTRPNKGGEGGSKLGNLERRG